jgi:hypothetical protein
VCGVAGREGGCGIRSGDARGLEGCHLHSIIDTAMILREAEGSELEMQTREGAAARSEVTFANVFLP